MTEVEWEVWVEEAEREDALIKMRMADAVIYGNPYLPASSRSSLWRSWQERAVKPWLAFESGPTTAREQAFLLRAHMLYHFHRGALN